MGARLQLDGKSHLRRPTELVRAIDAGSVEQHRPVRYNLAREISTRSRRAVCDPDAFSPFRSLIQGPFDDWALLEPLERFVRGIVLHDDMTMELTPLGLQSRIRRRRRARPAKRLRCRWASTDRLRSSALSLHADLAASL